MKKASKHSKNHTLNRLYALIALHAGKRTQPPLSACPDSEKLACLLDGKLDETERDQVLAHIDSCSACYETWLTLSSLQEQKQASKGKIIQGPWHRIAYLPPKQKTTAFLAVAACCVLILGVNLWNTPEKDGLPSVLLMQKQSEKQAQTFLFGVYEELKTDQVTRSFPDHPTETEPAEHAIEFQNIYDLGTWCGNIILHCNQGEQTYLVSEQEQQAMKRLFTSLKENTGEWAGDAIQLVANLHLDEPSQQQQVLGCTSAVPSIMGFIENSKRIMDTKK